MQRVDPQKRQHSPPTELMAFPGGRGEVRNYDILLAGGKI